jgi:hypothetical protein
VRTITYDNNGNIFSDLTVSNVNSTVTNTDGSVTITTSQFVLPSNVYNGKQTITTSKDGTTVTTQNFNAANLTISS